jgi:putative DNA primase/helicase
MNPPRIIPYSPDTPTPGLNPSKKERSFPEPIPLPVQKLEPVIPYPMHLLPDVIRPWLDDVSERGQFQPDYLAVVALSAMGAAIGRRCAVYLKQRDDWYEYPNLWAAVVGRPGAMKSPAMGQAMSPLRRIQSAWVDEHKEAMASYDKATERAKIDLKAAKAKAFVSAKKGEDYDLPENDVECPKAKRLITSDATEEKAGELMAANPYGLVLELDELAALYAMTEKNPSYNEFLLKAWNGKEGHTVDRIMRGTLHIEALCLSVIGGIQPGRIASRVKEAAQNMAGDGLLQRFQLVAFPDGWNKRWINVDRYPNREVRDAAMGWFQKMVEREPCSFPSAGDYGPRGLRFSQDAQALFDSWYEGQQQRVRFGELSESVEAAESKSPKLLAGLALILELGRNPAALAIESDTLRNAITFAEAAASHAKRLLTCHLGSAPDAARTIWSKIQEGRLKDGFTIRDVYRNEWKGVGDKDTAGEALDILSERGWLVPVESGIRSAATGRPASPSFLINPKAFALQ